MHHIKLKPNFNRIKDYLPHVTDDQLASLQASEGVDCYLEYMSEEGYNHFADGLKTIVNRYNIEDHYFELLYIILQKNEQIRVRYDAYWQNYEDELISKELATFLLLGKNLESENRYQLILRENGGTTVDPIMNSAKIKNKSLVRWISDLIYDAVDNRNFTITQLGEKLLYDLFENPNDYTSKISEAKLKQTAEKRLESPEFRLRFLIYKMCFYILAYLKAQPDLKFSMQPKVKVPNQAAKFLTEVLVLLKLVPEQKSKRKELYIHGLFQYYEDSLVLEMDVL